MPHLTRFNIHATSEIFDCISAPTFLSEFLRVPEEKLRHEQVEAIGLQEAASHEKSSSFDGKKIVTFGLVLCLLSCKLQ